LQQEPFGQNGILYARLVSILSGVIWDGIRQWLPLVSLAPLLPGRGVVVAQSGGVFLSPHERWLPEPHASPHASHREGDTLSAHRARSGLLVAMAVLLPV
jgi:hypothetical protein